jgi:hypothetical protein
MCYPIFSAQWINNEGPALRSAVPVVVRPFELDKYATMKMAPQLLPEIGIVVHDSWFADADVTIPPKQQDAPKAAAALAEARF